MEGQPEEIQRRMQTIRKELEEQKLWASKHDGRINEKWRVRDQQTIDDQRRFQQNEERQMQTEKKLSVLSSRVGMYATFGAILGGAVVQLATLALR